MDKVDPKTWNGSIRWSTHKNVRQLALSFTDQQHLMAGGSIGEEEDFDADLTDSQEQDDGKSSIGAASDVTEVSDFRLEQEKSNGNDVERAETQSSCSIEECMVRIEEVLRRNFSKKTQPHNKEDKTNKVKEEDLGA